MQHAMVPVGHSLVTVMVCLKWFSLWNITTCNSSDRPDDRRSARVAALAGYGMSGYYTIHFMFATPETNKIMLHVMHYLSEYSQRVKILKQNVDYLPTFGKRKMAFKIANHHFKIAFKRSAFSILLQSKEDRFKKHLLKMIMMLYKTTQHWFSQANAMAWFDCWFNHQEQQYTGRIEREDKRK